MIPLLAAALSAAIRAQPTLTLDQALEMARTHQPQLAQAQANLAAASARRREALAPLLPQLSGSADADHRASLGASGFYTSLCGSRGEPPRPVALLLRPVPASTFKRVS